MTSSEIDSFYPYWIHGRSFPTPYRRLFRTDESLVYQNISAGISICNNLKDPYITKLGAFSFDVKKNMMKAGNIDFTATMSTSIIFMELIYLKKRSYANLISRQL